jgi:hypothetical protein
MKRASGTDRKTTVCCAEFAAIQREMLARKSNALGLGEVSLAYPIEP